ncbi:hypothetical protein PIB30_079540 [Stylosanthes scabra]|uniref:Uncharacterized protein n=1 Tax=Stylosanthes scabra TaxID=79078 RepID=A0ABU6SRE5_9FABA|nr:hypothetical protein [Stylosanthes scabra]
MPSSLSQQYLDELKLTGVLFGGGDLERRYRVEAARRGKRVCFLNLDHPTVPHWLWVNEVIFTEFGVRIPFTDFQQRLLNRASVASSQLHPNAWSSIRCFELVTEFLVLPQDPEVFLFLFKFYSSNTSGKTKKEYMSVRLAKYHKLFGLFEDSIHDFKGRYFKIFPVGTHHPFWLSLEGDGRFPPYWSDQARFEIVPVTYERLNTDQKDTADILTHLFAKNNLAPKSLLGNPEEARKTIGNDVTLSRLHRLIRPTLSGLSSSATGTVPVGRARATSATSTGKAQVELDGGSSGNVANETERLVEANLLGLGMAKNSSGASTRGAAPAPLPVLSASPPSTTLLGLSAQSSRDSTVAPRPILATPSDAFVASAVAPVLALTPTPSHPSASQSVSSSS